MLTRFIFPFLVNGHTLYRILGFSSASHVTRAQRVCHAPSYGYPRRTCCTMLCISVRCRRIQLSRECRTVPQGKCHKLQSWARRSRQARMTFCGLFGLFPASCHAYKFDIFFIFHAGQINQLLIRNWLCYSKISLKAEKTEKGVERKEQTNVLIVSCRVSNDNDEWDGDKMIAALTMTTLQGYVT